MKVIDLRSDTVTKPSEAMRKAMYDAEVGDDVYKEDPTVNRLEEISAALFGKEASLFVPSGLMGNQICLNLWTNPGDEVICDYKSHIFLYESGGPGRLSGVQLYPVMGERGIITPEIVEPAIRAESAYYMPRTKVIEVENTHNHAGGIVQPLNNLKKLRSLANQYNLKMHLDGARIWNASATSGISPAEYSLEFDSVSACFSKGLGAPIGSVICGDKSFIKEAFRLRKAWGGGMRQVGILAAAAIFALENNLEKLKEDHEKAFVLADFIYSLPGVEINLANVQTNIIMFKPLKKSVQEVLQLLKSRGIIAGPMGDNIRLTTHLDISFEDIEYSKKIFEEVFSDNR